MPSRGLRFVLLAPPAVAAVRFLTKWALAWFLLPAEFGHYVLAGLVAHAVAHVALLGLNEALVQARRPGAVLWARLRRIHQLSGVAMAGLMLLLGWGFGALTGDALLGQLVMALGPMVWLANLATLPTALLVRQQQYARLFAVDVVAVLALAAAQLGLAAAGAGPWVIVGGLYANALVAAVLSSVLSRPFRLPVEPDEDALADVLSYGRHLCGAELMAFFGEQLDVLVLGFALGTAALGLYGQAMNLGGVLLAYTTSLAERSLFPILSERFRAGELAPHVGGAVRLAAVYLVPVHVALAVVAAPLVDGLLPDSWAGAAPLLVLLSLASGARCLDIVGATALKAAGLGRGVVRLAALRLGLLIVALAVSVSAGLWAVAFAVLVARASAAVVTVVAAWRLTGVSADGAVRASLWALAAWCVVFVGSSLGVERVVSLPPLLLLSVLLGLAAVTWLGTRWLLDRESLRQEFGVLLERARAASQPK